MGCEVCVDCWFGEWDVGPQASTPGPHLRFNWLFSTLLLRAQASSFPAHGRKHFVALVCVCEGIGITVDTGLSRGRGQGPVGFAEYLGNLLQLKLLWSLDWSRVGLFLLWSLAWGPGEAGWFSQGPTLLGPLKISV